MIAQPNLCTCREALQQMAIAAIVYSLCCVLCFTCQSIHSCSKKNARGCGACLAYDTSCIYCLFQRKRHEAQSISGCARLMTAIAGQAVKGQNGKGRRHFHDLASQHQQIIGTTRGAAWDVGQLLDALCQLTFRSNPQLAQQHSL